VESVVDMFSFMSSSLVNGVMVFEKYKGFAIYSTIYQCDNKENSALAFTIFIFKGRKENLTH
jgi:hypothetical protein